MPETTPHRPAEAYLQISPPRGAVNSLRDGRGMPAVRPSNAALEASRLLLDGQQLLQEARTAEAEPLLLRALGLYETQGSLPADCVPVLNDLASIATARGDLTAAESLFQRALELADVHLGVDHPDVAAILGGLARLYLRRSEYTKADPLLQRLLEIKRARGEEHPEVATVLASLATVRSAVGAHESAERILRRVLAIREKTLAPNHFATMTTIEHLGESCAARGKFEEAFTLLHRALTMRERTLGASHPSIAAARTRIADLELLSSNEELGSLPMLPPMMTALPVIEGKLDEPADEPVDEPDSAAAPPPDVVGVSGPPPEAVLRELYDESYDEWEEGEEPRHERRLLDQLNAKVGVVTAFARTSRGRVAVLAIGVTSLLAALVLAVRARADVAVPAANASIISPPTASSARTSADAGAGVKTGLTAQSPVAPPSARVTRAPDFAARSAGATVSVRRAARSESAETGATENADPIALPKAPRVRAFDGLVDGVPLAPVSAPVVDSAEFAPSRSSPRTQTVASGTTERARDRSVHATLPANNPAPAYPPELMRRRIEGRVVAEFLVDAKGRVDTRTLRIISSTDERFSQAVRDVLPDLRFLPAENDGVKTEEWVEMPFRFAPKPE